MIVFKCFYSDFQLQVKKSKKGFLFCFHRREKSCGEVLILLKDIKKIKHFIINGHVEFFIRYRGGVQGSVVLSSEDSQDLQSFIAA